MIIDNKKSSGSNNKGFTLIELLIVMTILGILASLAVPSYQRNVIKAREAVLLEDLFVLRSAIDAYFVDHARYPEELEDLVNEKYIRGIPRDPFTRKTDSWVLVVPEATTAGELAPGGFYDVHSDSDLVGLNGIPLSEW